MSVLVELTGRIKNYTDANKHYIFKKEKKQTDTVATSLNEKSTKKIDKICHFSKCPKKTCYVQVIKLSSSHSNYDRCKEGH